MKTATVKELKVELNGRSPEDLVNLCLRLSKFKKENKELLTYLLYESSNEAGFIRVVKQEINREFGQINMSSNFYIKKSVRKILRITKKYIRYSGDKETEVELMMYFCLELKDILSATNNNNILVNILNRQIDSINKAISSLHEDLQYDYKNEIDELLL